MSYSAFTKIWVILSSVRVYTHSALNKQLNLRFYLDLQYFYLVPIVCKVTDKSIICSEITRHFLYNVFSVSLRFINNRNCMHVSLINYDDVKHVPTSTIDCLVNTVWKKQRKPSVNLLFDMAIRDAFNATTILP